MRLPRRRRPEDAEGARAGARPAIDPTGSPAGPADPAADPAPEPEEEEIPNPVAAAAAADGTRERGERPSWDFSQGDEISPGRTVLKSLGGGSRYEVFLVWDEHRFAIMVAKCLRPDQAAQEGALRDLRKEAEALARLSHPVLVRGFDAVLDGPHPHVLIEHLEGPTLRLLLRRSGALGDMQLLPLGLNVAAALHYMHQEGMVHLDVKPDNIVMGLPPRLIDLSVARSVERAARITGIVGTDAYMAPEQCDASQYPGMIGPPADVWGLAATLFHAAAGKVPFPRERGARDSEDLEIRFPQLWADPIDPPQRMPPALHDLLLAAMDPEPDERPTAAEFASGMEPLVARLPTKMVLGRRGTRFR